MHVHNHHRYSNKSLALFYTSTQSTKLFWKNTKLKGKFTSQPFRVNYHAGENYTLVQERYFKSWGFCDDSHRLKSDYTEFRHPLYEVETTLVPQVCALMSPNSSVVSSTTRSTNPMKLKRRISFLSFRLTADFTEI